jgi:hypothetical protein
VRRVFWRLFFPFLYLVLRVADRLLWRWTAARGLGNTVELRVLGRRSGVERRVLVGLLWVGERRYLGHATPTAAWARNLAAAGHGDLVIDGGPAITVAAVPLPPGEERDAVVAAAGRQHPFPVDLAYRFAAGQIRERGTLFRIEPPAGTLIPLPAAAARRCAAHLARDSEPA